MALEDIDIFDRYLQTQQLQQDQRQQVADTIAPTPAQATYIASFLAPGSSVPDVSGIYPSFPSSQVDLIDAFSGDPMPSLSTNLREGNYFDASMQGLGMAGDALYATPMIGPVLGPTVGTGLKAVSGVGRGISSLNKVQRAQDLIKQGKASAGTQQATQKMVTPTQLEEGKIIDVRKNLNSSFDDPELEKFKAQTIHDVKTLKSGKISDSESNIGTGTALSYDPAVTVKSNGVPIELKVNQKARDSIASKTKPKFPMASVRGIYDELDIFDPDITLGFNPMKQNVFVDSQGYGVKAIKNGKASIVDNDVFVKLDNPDSFRTIKDADGNEVKLFDDIEYYDSNNLPKTKNPSEVKVLDAEPKDIQGIPSLKVTGLHGSPLKFDKFDLSKRPLDEFGLPVGLDRYGKGHYFTGTTEHSKKVSAAHAGEDGFVYKVEVPREKLLDVTTDLKGQPPILRKKLEKILPKELVKTNPSGIDIRDFLSTGQVFGEFSWGEATASQIATNKLNKILSTVEWNRPKKLPYGGEYYGQTGGAKYSGVDFVVHDESIIKILKTSTKKDKGKGITKLMQEDMNGR
jgi:hypothetical protein